MTTAAVGRAGPARARVRAVTLAVTAGLLISASSVVMLAIGVVTLFQARRLYAWMAKWTARAVLGLYGVRVAVHQKRPFPHTQTVYISEQF